MSKAATTACLFVWAFVGPTLSLGQEAALVPIPANSAPPSHPTANYPADANTAAGDPATNGPWVRFVPEMFDQPSGTPGCGCNGGNGGVGAGTAGSGAATNAIVGAGGLGSPFGGIPYSPGCLDLHGCPRPPLLYQSPRGPWYVVNELVALKRDADDRRIFAATPTLLNIIPGTPVNDVLNTDDLEFEHQAGYHVLIGRQLNDCMALEGSYLGLMEWDEQQAVRNTTLNAQGTLGNLLSPFSNFGSPAAVVGLDFNTFASIRVVSSLDNAEINLRQRLDTPPSMMQASALYGFRYMRIQERFEYRTQSLSPAPVGAENSVDVDTGNHLYGFQIGGMVELRVEPRCWVSFEVKGAICHNEAEQHTQYSAGPLGAAVAFPGFRGEDRTTFVGDLALAAECKFTPRIVGRIGYQALLIDGLALASENFERNVAILTAGPAELVHDGSVVYHGPFVGLTTTW